MEISKTNMAIIIGVAAVIVAVVCIVAVTSGGSGEDTPDEPRDGIPTVLWLDAGDGKEPSQMKAYGYTMDEILKDGLSSHSIEFLSNGNIKSVDGKENTDKNAWTVFKWMSPEGWVVYKDTHKILNDMNICVKYSDILKDDKGKVTYSAPDIKVTYDVYFYFQIKDPTDTYWINELPLSAEEKQKGLWIKGTGSTSSEALGDATLKTFFPKLSYNVKQEDIDGKPGMVYHVDGKDNFYTYGIMNGSYGWFVYYLGWTDTLVQDGWKYWTQYNYNPRAETDDDPDSWDFNGTTFGEYDITEYKYFAVILDVTSMAPSDIDIPTPSTIPEELIG